MQQRGNHNKKWNASDFERYYSSKMNKEEMYALENDALNDVFLQDAFEGYKNTQSPINDIDEIKKKFSQKNQRKLVPIEWYRQKKAKEFLKIAATVFLFIGLGWLFYNNKEDVQSNSNAELAQLKKEPKNEQAASDATTATIADSTISAGQPYTEKAKNIVPLKENNPAEIKPGAATTGIKNDVANKISHKVIVEQNDNAKAEAKESAQPRQSPMPGLSSEKNYSGAVNNMNQHIFSGTVKDQSGQPVSNAVVYDTKTRNRVQTDAEGNFKFQANDSSMSIAINAIGYEPAKQSINAKDMFANNIVLQKTQQELSEVVITSATAKMKKSSSPVSTVKIRGAVSSNQNAEPVYVVNSLLLPAGDFKQIPPDFIKSIQVINEKNATAIYGSLAANGVVIVTLKENQSLHRQANVTLNNVIITSGDKELRQFAQDSLIAVGNKKTVELKFDTDDAGKPVRIAVKNSVCSSCDNKAIQMLNLATWQKIKKGRKAEVKLNF